MTSTVSNNGEIDGLYVFRIDGSISTQGSLSMFIENGLY